MRLFKICLMVHLEWDFNPRTSYEVRRRHPEIRLCVSDISIHAPLTRCDVRKWYARIRCIISIHAPLTRCDNPFTTENIHNGVFQSTHLLRGATHRHDPGCCRSFDFNPRTSYEVRQSRPRIPFLIYLFQSTHLLRGATSLVF